MYRLDYNDNDLYLVTGNDLWPVTGTVRSRTITNTYGIDLVNEQDSYRSLATGQ